MKKRRRALMSRWTLWLTQVVKWNLFIIESYITLIVATIIFNVFFNGAISLTIFEIWLMFFLISIPKIVTQKEEKWMLYFIVLGIFVFGWLFLHLSVFPWIFTLMFILWRTLSLETIKDEIYEDYINRILFYIVLVIIYYLTNSFYQFSNALTVNYSFVIVIFSFLLGGMLQQLKTSSFSKELLRAFSIQLGVIVAGISLFVLFFSLLKNPIFQMISKIKVGFEIIFYWIGYWFYQLRKLLGIDAEKIDSVYDQMYNSKENEEIPIQDIYQGYNTPFIIEIIIYLTAALIIFGVLLLVFHLIKGIIKARSTIHQQVKQVGEIQQLDNISRKKRIVSANFYRKLYQSFLLWLLKKKKISYFEPDTSQKIKSRITSNYSDISDEIDAVTSLYQQARYGERMPKITKKEYKDLLKKLKKMIIADKKN